VQETVASLPRSLRADLREPLGPVYEDVGDLLADAGRPLVTVGDVVTYHVLGADAHPEVAVVDGRTERAAVDDEVAARLADLPRTHAVANEPGTLSATLVAALVEGFEAGAVVEVDGEEDLAALPAVAAAPDGATVVYGQPGEGMVAVTVDAAARERALDLLACFDVEDRLWELLGRSP
jgi:uncharacterized protein (UPF0218 family)